MLWPLHEKYAMQCMGLPHPGSLVVRRAVNPAFH